MWFNVGKGEIACYEQFLLFLTVFSENFKCRHVKTRACLGKGKTMSFPFPFIVSKFDVHVGFEDPNAMTSLNQTKHSAVKMPFE